MSAASRSGHEAEQGESASWAAESLPLSVRKELLEHELRRLGFRKAPGRSGGTTQQQQQQPADGSSSHPQADDNGQHGD